MQYELRNKHTDSKQQLSLNEDNLQCNNSRILSWIFLIAAISLEVAGITLLQAIPIWLKTFGIGETLQIYSLNLKATLLSKINLLCMIALSYYCMSLALRKIALGVAYSVWEIVGLIGILLVSFIFFEPTLTLQQYCGIAIGFIGIICVIMGEEHK